MRAANLALKFLLELAAIAALAYWGATAADGVPAVALAVGAPALFIVLWGRFAAPRAAHRLPARSRIPFELGLFALAALAWCSPAARSSRRCSPCWLSSTPRS